MATTKAQAKEQAEAGRFDVAIVDVDLAGENGLELLSYFKSRDPRMPVIIFSGVKGGEVVQKAMAAGAAGFMSKTSSLGELFGEVNRHLPEAPARPE